MQQEEELVCRSLVTLKTRVCDLSCPANFYLTSKAQLRCSLFRDACPRPLQLLSCITPFTCGFPSRDRETNTSFVPKHLLTSGPSPGLKTHSLNVHVFAHIFLGVLPPRNPSHTGPHTWILTPPPCHGVP